VDLLLNPEVWVAFLTLVALEIVLGIDNIVFISIIVDKLPEHRQALARRLGLGMALVMRILLLLSLSWVIGLTAPLFTVLGQEISGRDVILIGGGLFLLGKSTYEIHENLEGEEGHSSAKVQVRGAVYSPSARYFEVDLRWRCREPAPLDPVDAADPRWTP
jgi:predicted tellurium resistance membrane protein TerC